MSRRDCGALNQTVAAQSNSNDGSVAWLNLVFATQPLNCNKITNDTNNHSFQAYKMTFL